MQVSVVTGNIKGAGTDANVSCILYGEFGDSGERKLEKSKTHMNKFEKGQTDIFEISGMVLNRSSKLLFKNNVWQVHILPVTWQYRR